MAALSGLLSTRARVVTAIGVCLVVAFLAVAWYWGPYDHAGVGCTFCGKTRTEWWWLGLRLRVGEERETEASKWVCSIYPEHRDHEWRRIAGLARSRWFGGVEECYGGCDVWVIFRLRATLGEEKARALLAEYHTLLKGDRKALLEFLQDLRKMKMEAEGRRYW